MEEARNYGKFYASKTFLKMAGGRMHTPHSTPLAVSYRNHQKSQAYFSHLALLILFFFTKKQSQKGGAMAQSLPPKYALVSTFKPIKVLMVDFQKKVVIKRSLLFLTRPLISTRP